MNHTLLVVLALLGTPQVPAARPRPDGAGAPPPRFAWPCDGYGRGLRGAGSFGAYVDSPGSPFHASWHLAEDVWLPPGTPVRSIADGLVRYSAFSPTWTDRKGVVHWNLGNVIVVEHPLDPPVEGHAAVCSFYVHLAADRRVKPGDRVARGAPLGRIGADRSDENGRYPAHLHFGIHAGPYFQVPPAFERRLRRAAASPGGLRVGPNVLRGPLELRRQGETGVFVRTADGRADALLSLLVGSTAPESPPPDIMCWCEGYGPRETLTEWLPPSRFLERNGAGRAGER
jgi:murein DD-endopeptidase MepM/ murein hydrolase activator NlpD